MHWGFPVAILAALVIAGVLAFSRWGYEVRLAGSNPSAAHYAGMPVRRHLITVMLLSGAIAGLAGMLEIAGTVHRLQGGISNNYGYLGIMVAVLARSSAIGVIFSAALMAFILNSGIILQTQGLTTSAVLAITGLILFLSSDRRRTRPLPPRPRQGLKEKETMELLTGLLTTAFLAGGVLALARPR